VRRATSFLSCSFSIAISCEHVSIITFLKQTWSHRGESNLNKSLQEVEASFFIVSKFDFSFLGALGVLPIASSLAIF
jgi:hypothetical protein